MVTRWRSGLAAAAVTVLTVVLVVLDVADPAVSSWWTGHALTASTVSGLLVLLVTVLVVDQVGDLRRARTRSRATAAQAAIVLGQAQRSGRSVDTALAGDATRDDAAGDVRNYLVMLLVGGPSLIDTTPSRVFLEEAQRLGAVMTRMLATDPEELDGPAARSRLAEATERLQAVAAPLLDVLHPAERTAVTAGDDTTP